MGYTPQPKPMADHTQSFGFSWLIDGVGYTPQPKPMAANLA